MRPSTRQLRSVLDWLVFAFTALVGVLALTVVATRIGEGQRAPTMVAGVSAAGLLLVLGSAAAVFHNRKLGAVLCFAAGGLAEVLLVVPSAFVFPGGLLWSETLSASLVAILPGSIPGAYWLITGRIGWPPTFPMSRLTRRRRIAGSIGVAVLLYLMVGTGDIVMRGNAQPIGDCGGVAPIFVRPASPNHAAFVARVIALGVPYRHYHGKKLSGWAVASVQQKFWGLPWWNSKIVVLMHPGFQTGQTYFIDGERGGGFLTLGLPVVRLRSCGRSSPIRGAIVEMRVLQDGPPKNGVRIIGRVVNDYPDYHSSPLPQVQVLITGPNGTMVTTTDQHGIYDVQGLPQGTYAIRAGTYDQTRHQYPSCNSKGVGHLVATGDVWGCTLSFWIPANKK